MKNELLFGYLGVFANVLIISEIVKGLLKGDNLQDIRYKVIILFIFSGIFWSIYGVRNKLLPTTFLSLFQLVVFVFVFMLKYYEGVNDKHIKTKNEEKVSELGSESAKKKYMNISTIFR